MLDHDVLDTAGEIQALNNILRANSTAGLALAAHIPEPGTLGLLVLGGLALMRRRRR
ncbi:MAG: PEP-CTERM sorting domain-containing protein [Planctomycetota bacterium]|nr:PEP-CTERM sorting domain-containing protein [Planctomycetota bacterium]